MGLAALSGLLLAGCSSGPTTTSQPASPGTFRNPLVAGAPDPWMTYYQGNYYLAATTWGDAFTGLTMRKAPTIAGLKSATARRIWQDWDSDRCCNYWAPEFFLLDGPSGSRWYGYFAGGPASCCDNQRIHVIESAGSDPMGPYTYKGRLADSIGRPIDPSILQLDGSVYLLFAGRTGDEQRLYIASMANPWTAGDPVQLSAPTYDWEKVGRAVNQGPVALQHDGKTFVVYSASYCGGPGYSLGMLTYRGGNPLRADSWAKSARPVFAGTDEVFSPGHNTFFRSPDGSEDWIVYHASDSAGGNCDMSRSPRIQKFSWNSDGTPNFGTPAPLGVELRVPAGEARPTPASGR